MPLDPFAGLSCFNSQIQISETAPEIGRGEERHRAELGPGIASVSASSTPY